VINNFADATDLVDVMKPIVFTFLYIGLFIWVSSYFYYFLLVILSERLGAKTKVAYLNAILQQEISWFDEINPSEFSVRLVKECQAIQKALGDKMGTLLLSLAMCISGLFFAFFRGWAMSLILMAAFPIVFIMIGMFMKAM
jgi:ATP-binding cassette subfamily B (MDR/TAP) protein 1